MAVINCSMSYPHQKKIPKYCLTASSGGRVWNNSGVAKLRY